MCLTVWPFPTSQPFEPKTFSHTVITKRYPKFLQKLSFNEHQPRERRTKKAKHLKQAQHLMGSVVGWYFEDRKSSEITTRNYNTWADVVIVRKREERTLIRSHLKSWRWYGEERHRWSIMWRGTAGSGIEGDTSAERGHRVIHGEWNEFLLDLDGRNLHAAAISAHVKTRFIAPFRALLTWDIQNRLKVRTLERVQMSDSSEL